MTMTTVSSKPTTPEAVLAYIEPGADIIVPLANGEPVSVLDAVEAHAERAHRHAGPPDARPARPALPTALRGHLLHVSYFLSHVTRPALPRRRRRAGAQQLQRGAPAPAGDTPVPAGRGRRLAAGPPRLLLPRDQLRLHRVASSAGPVLPRGQRPDAADLRPQPGPREPGRRDGRRSTGRSSRSPPASPTDADRRIAAFVAERIPDGATSRPASADPQRAARRPRTIATWASTPSCSPTGSSTSSSGRGHRHPQAARPGKVVTTFALGTQRLYDFLHENPAVELRARRLRQRPPGDRRGVSFVSINATTEVDFLASARRRRWPARTGPPAAARPTSPGARCTPTAGRASSSSRRPPPRHGVADPGRAHARLGGHHRQEHGRPHGHRIGVASSRKTLQQRYDDRDRRSRFRGRARARLGRWPRSDGPRRRSSAARW